MTREIVLVSVMIALSLLVVSKGDKQIIHILEGKLFQLDRDTSYAKVIYRKHTDLLSVILFALGFAAIGISIILLASDMLSLFLVSAVVSLFFVGLGIWGRMRSFRAADQELDRSGEAIGNGSAI